MLRTVRDNLAASTALAVAVGALAASPPVAGAISSHAAGNDSGSAYKAVVAAVRAKAGSGRPFEVGGCSGRTNTFTCPWVIYQGGKDHFRAGILASDPLPDINTQSKAVPRRVMYSGRAKATYNSRSRGFSVNLGG